MTLIDHEGNTRVAIVTGASSGIGRAAARMLAGAGYRVVAVGRSEQRLDETAEGFASIRTHVGDLRDPSEPDRIVEAAVDAWDRLDVLVNNAGILARMSVEEAASERIHDLLAINVVAPSLLLRAAVPSLSIRGGSIINVSSTMGRIPSPGVAHYGASKAALDHLTRTWAVELAPLGIRVNGIAPGPTESRALESAGLSQEEIAHMTSNEEHVIPLGRRGVPHDIAEWIVMFAGESAAWVTGQVLGVDGGLEVA